jgi:hypothetical protein
MDSHGMGCRLDEMACPESLFFKTTASEKSGSVSEISDLATVDRLPAYLFHR